MKFTKMHGIGNDYVYVNCFKEKLKNPEKVAVSVSNRNFGIGSDGLILICPSKKADARMVMYNSDGSTSEMCGNGVRCVAKYVYDHGISRKKQLKIETGRGVLTLDLTVKNGKVSVVRVNMGEPILDAATIPTTLKGGPIIAHPLNAAGKIYPATFVSMGNPHCVIYVKDVKKFPVQEVGPILENHPIFPRRANIEFVEIISRKEVIQRTWERGAGETLACGTGASAVCVAGVLNGKTDRKILNHLSGGDLSLEWVKDGPVFMTGPAMEVFSGEWISPKH